MFLRSIVGNYVRQAASTHLRDIVDQKVKQTEEMQQKRGLEPVAAAVIFASGVESGGLIDLLTDQLKTKYDSFVEHSGHYKGRTIVIAESGAGPEHSAAASRDLIDFHKPPLIFAAGFAAALRPELKKGHILMAEKVSCRTGEVLEFQFSIDRESVEAKPNWHLGHLVSLDEELRNYQQRKEVATETDADACDMETFAIGTVCKERGIPCVPVRVIADGFRDDDRQVIDLISGQRTIAGKLGAATGALWRKPKIAKQMIGLKQSAIERSDELAAFLVGLIGQLPKPQPASASETDAARDGIKRIAEQ